VEEYDVGGQLSGDNTTLHMHTACWVTKATDTHSEYVKILVLPLQQLSRERTSTLRYT